MRVLHLASSNRWTGAAAPAFAEVEALRLSGIDAEYASVGGYKLEQKLAGIPYARPVITKRQSPAGLVSSLRELRRIVARAEVDVIHCHLTYDHLLGSLLKRGTNAVLVRTFHSRRTLRRDPFTAALLSRTDGICLINAEMAIPSSQRLHAKPISWTPPPVDHRLFNRDGSSARAALGIPSTSRVLGIIGKLAPDRGFEAAVLCLAALFRTDPSVRLMIIGHSSTPHRPFIDELARNAGVAEAVIWAGYHEEDLSEYYRACDAMLFTSAGSDEGHRAVLEEMACGVIPVSYPIPGVQELTGELSSRLVTTTADPQALAETVRGILADPAIEELRRRLAERSQRFGFESSARHLEQFYGEVLLARSRTRPSR